MITTKNLYEILENKIANEAQKSIIRNSFPPQIAEKKCDVIDKKEGAEHFKRFLEEYSDWLFLQQRQQEAIRQFLMQYYYDQHISEHIADLHANT